MALDGVRALVFERFALGIVGDFQQRFEHRRPRERRGPPAQRVAHRVNEMACRHVPRVTTAGDKHLAFLRLKRLDYDLRGIPTPGSPGSGGHGGIPGGAGRHRQTA